MDPESKIVHPDVTHPNELLSPMPRINKMVLNFSAKILGSIYFFYFCILLDIIELPPVIHANSVIVWVTYISQTVIQLVALPLLQAYQNIQQSQSEAKAEADHRTLVHIAYHQDQVSNKIDDILKYVKRLDKAKKAE